MPGENGKLIDAVAPTAATTLNQLSYSVSQTANFDVADKTSTLTDALADIGKIINDFNNGATPDISDAAQLQKIIAVSQSANHPTCTNLPSDSWAVSSDETTQPYATCTLSGTHTYATNTECSLANIQGRTGSCLGCLDTTKILNALVSDANMQAVGDWKTILDARYTAAGCTTFNTYFGNVWDNYYFVKVKIVTDIKVRWTTADTNIGTIISSLSNLQTDMNNAITNLQGLVDSVTNADFGLIAGLNCRLIGEDIMLIVNSVCVSNFNTIYITRLAM